MGFTFNEITLVGKLGNDAETRQAGDSSEVTNFTIATNYSFKKKDGSYQEETTWHKITVWGLSEWHKEFLRKGVDVFLKGRLNIRSYDDKDGNKRYITEVIADKNSIILFPKAVNEKAFNRKKEVPDKAEVMEDGSTLPY